MGGEGRVGLLQGDAGTGLVERDGLLAPNVSAEVEFSGLEWPADDGNTNTALPALCGLVVRQSCACPD